MALIRGLQQHMVEARTGAQDGVMRYADLLGNSVRRSEPDPVDVPGQRVRVGLNAPDGLLPVGLIDTDSPAGADSLGMKEHHDVADDLLLGPGSFDSSSPLGPNAFHFLEADRVVLDDVEDLLAKLSNQFPGVNRPNALDHAAAQVLLDALVGGRGRAVEKLSAELEAEIPVADPTALGGHPFAGTDRGQRPDDGDLVAMSLGLDLEHRKQIGR